jgi:hypothetical protein
VLQTNPKNRQAHPRQALQNDFTVPFHKKHVLLPSKRCNKCSSHAWHDPFAVAKNPEDGDFSKKRGNNPLSQRSKMTRKRTRNYGPCDQASQQNRSNSNPAANIQRMENHRTKHTKRFPDQPRAHPATLPKDSARSFVRRKPRGDGVGHNHLSPLKN